MNRWRQRFNALLVDPVPPATAPTQRVHNVQNVQNLPTRPPFEQFEQFEQFEHRSRVSARAAISDSAFAAPSVPAEWVEGCWLLDPDHPPRRVPPMRWRQLVRDARQFVVEPLAATAASLGWSALDLFGCDRIRPVDRIDRAGVLWLVAHGRIVALTSETAVIETARGSRQTYRRTGDEAGRALPWELSEPTSPKFATE